MPEKTHRVAVVKKEIVKKIVKLIAEYPIVGVVNMDGLPSTQLQAMRKQLRGKVEMFMTKISLMKLALEDSKKTKKGVESLDVFVTGMPAFLFTRDNPFSLYKSLKKNMSPAAAKPGQMAPKDIVVHAGPTPFTPGPVISEFAALGIKAGVEGGKVAVKQDTMVCKAGKPISGPLASMLTRLGILPFEIGLNVVAVYENGVVYKKDVLDIDEKVFLDQIMQAAQNAFNLAIEIALPVKDTVEILLQKAFRDAKAVAVEINFMADAVVEELVEKAEREMRALKAIANIPDALSPSKEPVGVSEIATRTPSASASGKTAISEHELRNSSGEFLVSQKFGEISKTQEHASDFSPAVLDVLKETVTKMVGAVKKHETPQPVAEMMVTDVKKNESKNAEPVKIAGAEKDIVAKLVQEVKRKETPGPSAEKIVEEVKKGAVSAEADKSRQKEIDDIAALAKKLIKKGTLR